MGVVCYFVARWFECEVGYIVSLPTAIQGILTRSVSLLHCIGLLKHAADLF